MTKSRTIFTGDNLPILRGMDSESIDLIYLDPPFNSKRDYAAPIGSEAAGAEFKDTWTLSDTDDAWWGEIAEMNPALYKVIDAAGAVGGKGNKAYCIYMAIRLLEMHRVLKPTGSIVLHCDPTMSYSLKMLADAIFGTKNFISEIVWNYGTPSGGRAGGKKPVKAHDILLAYAVSYGRHVYNRVHTPYTDKYITNWFRHKDADGRKYRTRSRQGKIIKQYLDESPGVPLSNVWSDIMQLYGSAGWFPKRKTDERTGYPTQKPLALLRRIIRVFSNPGDMVLDPFCGCATACLAAMDENRDWIGIDISPKAFDLINQRMKKEFNMFGADTIHRKDIPIRSDAAKRSKNIKHVLFGRQSGICKGCQHDFPFRNFHIDHVIPTSKGGADDDSNLQLLCGACNSMKGNRSMEYLLAKLKDEGVRR